MKIAVFISLTGLVKGYRRIPKKIMENSIVFAGSDRRWVFPQTEEDVKDSLSQPTDYLSFPEDFKEFILQKEKEGKAFWLKPECDYQKISDNFAKIINPNTGKNFNGLHLDDNWWMEKYKKTLGGFSPSGKDIVSNYQRGSHDYFCVEELIRKSNQDMVPVFTWDRWAQHEFFPDAFPETVMPLHDYFFLYSASIPADEEDEQKDEERGRS